MCRADPEVHRPSRELGAATHDIKIGVTIPVRVEEHGVHVLEQTVGAESRLWALAERSIALLEE
jgi:hypothetical protein